MWELKRLITRLSRGSHEVQLSCSEYVLVGVNVWLLAGTQADVDLAVSVAKKAFESWSKLPGHVRARHLYSIARHVQKHAR